MPSAEYQSERFNLNNEPLNPSPLPPELAEFLKDRPRASLNDEILTAEKVLKALEEKGAG